jgi:hypothetical protein
MLKLKNLSERWKIISVILIAVLSRAPASPSLLVQRVELDVAFRCFYFWEGLWKVGSNEKPFG